MYKYQYNSGNFYITLPPAPSINEKFSSSTFRPTKKFYNYKKAAIDFLSLQNCKPIKTLRKGKRFVDRNIELYIQIFDTNNMRDIDCSEKVLQDILTGFAYEDDRQIWVKNTLIRIDKEKPRVEITVGEIRRN